MTHAHTQTHTNTRTLVHVRIAVCMLILDNDGSQICALFSIILYLCIASPICSTGKIP